MAARSTSIRLPSLPPGILGRAVVLLVSLSLVLIAVFASAPREVSGSWTLSTTLDGTASSSSLGEHVLEIALPASLERDGLRVDAPPASIALRAAAGANVRVTLLDSSGARILDAQLDPSNPMSAPHGPPTARLAPGTYRLVVTSDAAEPESYRVEATTTFPFTASRDGLVVSPLALLLPAALAASVALGPLAVRALSLSRAPRGESEPQVKQP